jgi:hypothetical protein
VLADFFNIDDLLSLQPFEDADCTIVFGTGAALLSWDAPIVYLDVPKNEIQYRMRAGSITNFGSKAITRSADMYKRFYFVDWVLLNEHKKNIGSKITVIADGQWKESLNWMLAESLQTGLSTLSQSVFRVRPWFEAGAWGGQWMKDKIRHLNKEEVNYAWSFELIVPENGLVFESNGYLLEVSFDFLMFFQNNNVLGKHADVFGYEFPIRFDFLDTWEGGNLSIQCHPTLQYIRENFGETITQDETYYILDCKDDAQVFSAARHFDLQHLFNAADVAQIIGESNDLRHATKVFRWYDFAASQIEYARMDLARGTQGQVPAPEKSEATGVGQIS